MVEAELVDLSGLSRSVDGICKEVDDLRADNKALRQQVSDVETVWIRFDPLRPNRVPRTWGALREYCAAREANAEGNET